MTTLDTFTRGGFTVTQTAPSVRRRIPGTRRWATWTGTGWADSAPAAAPDTLTAPSAVTVRWVAPEIVPDAPRTAPVVPGYMRPRKVQRPYDPDRLDMVCLHGHTGLWRPNAKGHPECAGCRAAEGVRYRAKLAERADAG